MCFFLFSVTSSHAVLLSIFAVPMREWLGECSCTSSSFPVAVLGGALCICICGNEVLSSYLSMEVGGFVIFRIFKSILLFVN